MMATSTLNNHLDLHEVHEYPIVLGDSFKETTQPRSKYVQFRYNWEPSDGFRKGRSTLKQDHDELRLSYHQDKSSIPVATYSGFYASKQGDKDEKDPSRLVLVFDESKSVFVLERVATSIDLNINSSAELSKDDLRKQRQLRRPHSNEDLTISGSAPQNEDDEADSSNPFDYRHFLSEARETMEKTAQQTGNKTPLHGNSTPIARVASPSLGGGRFTNSSSLLPSSAPAAAHRRAPSSQAAAKSKAARKTQTKKKEPLPAKAIQPLSKERISDSDEDLSDAAPVEPTNSRSHSRNTGSATIRSSDIMSARGGLEIIGGSPPPEPRPSYRIDVEAFRSQTHTPTLGISRSAPRTQSEDVTMKDADDSESSEEDGDVETFELDRDTRPRREDRDRDRQGQTGQSLAPEQSDDDDNDDALVAELMEALEEEEEQAESAKQNRRSTAYGHVDEEESEISEEE